MDNTTPVDMPTTDQEPENALTPLKLAELPEILRLACTRAGWAELMPVQCFSLPYMLRGQDLMVQSRTGSGKTGAYLLPMLDRLNPDVAAVQGLVLVPTRELAVQVEREARSLFEGTGLTVAAVYGGVGYDKQVAALRQGVSLVVGTPGRILDHLLRHTLTLDRLRSLVFDEADRMLSIGFYPDMKEIQRYLPDKPEQANKAKKTAKSDKSIHATLFSATYPPYVLRLAGEFLREPELLSLSSSHVHVAEVEHAYCECQPMDKDRTLLRLIELENPSSAIIFCNTKANVHYVTAVLQGFGLCADELCADLSQNRREEVLGTLRQGALRFLVATDVAARGIDIPELSHVFLYEPPEDRESYIHRAGRTGRAGAAGMVISLVDIMQKLELNRIAQFYHIQLTRLETPTEEDVSKALGQRVQTLLESRYRQLGSLTRERLARLAPLARQLVEDPEQLALLTLLLDGAYQQCLNPDAASLPPARAPRATPAGPTSARPAKPRAEDGRSRKRPTPRTPEEQNERPERERLETIPDAVRKPENSDADRPAPPKRRRSRRATGEAADGSADRPVGIFGIAKPDPTSES